MAATGPTETMILIGMHHISVDAGTFDVLWDQLADHYEHGRLPDVPVGYAAHGAWQRRQVESSRAHWLEQSRRRRPSGTLGFRTPTPAEPDGYLSLRLDVSPADLAPRGSTGFAAAMAATATTLARATAQSSVEFGITASTKDHVDVAPVVGYHLNTIPMAMDVRHGDRFADVVRAASEAISSSIDHRAYPFASIVRDARASGYVEPDVSCMLAYEQLASSRFPGGTAEHRILASGTSVSDVTFFVQERASAVQLGLEYRGSVLSRDDARRLLDVFAGVLVDGARHNTATVAELVDGTAEGDLVGPALPPPERSVLDRLVARAAEAPDAVAVVDAAGRRRSYGELVVAASALAARVEDLAGGRPRRVGVAVRRSVDLVTAMLAAQLSGASYVPLDPSAPVERLRLAVESAALDVLVVDGLDAATVGVAPDRIVELAGVDLTAGEHGDAADRAARVELDDPAYLIFTSGSTGTPRGVEVSHRNLASSNDARILHYGVTPARFLVTSSIGFDSSIAGLVWPLTTGGTVVVPGDDDVHDVDRLGALVDGLAVSHVLMVPSLYRALLERAGGRLAGLDTAVVAGEACPPGLVRRHHELVPGVELVNEYGPTEATVWSTVHTLRVDDASASSVPIGLPIPGTTLRVVDDQLAPVLSGVAGELLICSPGVVAGYLHRERPEGFVELDGRRWYRTGDLVRLVAGVVEFLGRVDDQLNVGGVRLEPGEVEADLLRIEGIRDAVVVAAGDPAVLVAHVVGDVVDEQALRSTLSLRLPPPAVPRWFVQHDELPRTSHGKVDRSAAARLPLPVVAPVSTERSPDDPVVELVVATWRDVLGRDDVTAHTDFFALGGDSLSAVAIVTALGDDLGEMVPIATLLAGRTPNGMAERLAPSVAAPAAGADETFGIVTFRDGAPGGPLVVLAPSWFDVFGYQDLAFAFADDVRVDALVYVQQPGTPPVTTVADMADGFEPLAAAMVDGRTDVAIVGWSVGGVVAAELANRLTAEGRTVRFVGMVDTYFPGEVRHVWSNRWWKYRSMLRPGATSEIVAEIGVTIRRRARRVAGRVGRRLVAWSGSPLPPEAVRSPVGTKVPPEAQYHPLASIDVPLVLYRASTTNPARTIEKWRTLAPSLDDIVIEGRHRGFDSIMEAGKVDRIADDVDRRLRPPTS
jgi:amino acid adenylation domain-containing protein